MCNSCRPLLIVLGFASHRSHLFSQPVFPIRISENKRHLVDQAGKPFPILGRTAWCVISQTREAHRVFIEHSKLFGYNSIEMSAIPHWRLGNHAPSNGRGEFPFLKKLNGSEWRDSLDYSANQNSPDFTTPNEPYWKYLDEFIDYCAEQGILIFLFPAYIGYHDGDQGWMEELAANGPEKIRTYGAWVAERYKNRKNLVWMLLGDDGKFATEQKRATEAALIEGLKSVQGQQSLYYSAESYSGENSADNEIFGNEMTMNGVYNWERHIAAQGIRAYKHEPRMPAYLLEEPYDEEGPDGNNYNPNAIQPVRRFQWWGWLTTIGGYVAGNGYIWPFIDPYWKQHLNSAGAQDMKLLNGFIKSINWWQLVPSGLDSMKTLVIAGNTADTTETYVAAACTRKGDLLVAYIPPKHQGSITLDLTVLGGPSTAKWFDPTNGKYSLIKGSISPKSLKREFSIPGKNSAGENDWVLVITKSGSTP